MKRLSLVVLLLLGCHKSKVSDDAGPARLPFWEMHPGGNGPLYTVLDGDCRNLTLFPAGDRAVLAFSRSVSALVRVDDDGLVADPRLTTASDSDAGAALAWSDPRAIGGNWPALTLYQLRPGRTQGKSSVWTLGEHGWTALERSDDTEDSTYILPPTAFRGWLVSARTWFVEEGPKLKHPSRQILRSWPLEKTAPPIAGLESLAREKLHIARFESSSDSIYAFGNERGTDRFFVRILTDGKVVEGPDSGKTPIRTHHLDKALIEVFDQEVIRREGVKTTKLPFSIEAKESIKGSGIAPNGDVWIETTNWKIFVLRDGVVTATALPAPAKPVLAKDEPMISRTSNTLAGIEVDDPWAIGASGALFHFDGGKWAEVPLPRSPFATSEYRAQTILEKTKGDLFVTAQYIEQGPGWKSGWGYQALLRSKKPKEAFRCTDAIENASSQRAWFMSSPPLAEDACRFPFAILLRLGLHCTLYNAAQDFPALQKVIKETPSLGKAAEIIVFEWGGQKYAGVLAPTVASARELAMATAQKVKPDAEGSPYITRPEVVCGMPIIEKTIHVEISK